MTICKALCLKLYLWSNPLSLLFKIDILFIADGSFAASGVDAVGEVVMNVDILPQPNGEHKISIKG